MDRCYCDECGKLDRMRLQGIPGTYQMGLGCEAVQSAAPPAPAMPAAIAALLAPSADDLPLFIGSLEPTLF